MNCNPCCGCFPPITTYNPSVADSFPTILQQVEYLKVLLKKYPSQQWFITQDKVTEETVKLDSTKIPLRGRAIEVGDFILGNTVDGTILIFQYTGVMIETTYYAVQYVGIYSSQILAEQALRLAETKQDKLNDKSDVTVLYLTATNGINAGTVKAGEMSDSEDNVYNFPKKAGTFALAEDVTAVGTKAQNALDLAMTNETDIATLDGQVAQINNNIKVLKDATSIEVILTPATATRGTLTDEQLTALLFNDNCYIRHNGLIYTLFKRNDENTVLQYTVGYLNETRYIQNIRVIVSSKVWQIDNIVLPQAKTYKHHLTFTSSDSKGYADIYSTNNTKIDSLTDLKTILGNTFQLPVFGEYAYMDGGDNYHYFDYCFVTESKIYVRSYYNTDGVSPDEQKRIITDVNNVVWTNITITDTVTTI